MEAKWLDPTNSLNSASIFGIGYCSALVAAFTRRRSIIVLKFYLVFFGAMYGAACQAACGLISWKPVSTSFVNYTSMNFLYSKGYLLTFTFTGSSEGSKTILIGLIFAGSPLPKRILNTALFLVIISFSLACPCFERPFCTASAIQFSRSFSISSLLSSSKSTYTSSLYNLSSSNYPPLWKTDSAKRAAMMPSLSSSFPSSLKRSDMLMSSSYLSLAALSTSRISYPRDSNILLPRMGEGISFFR